MFYIREYLASLLLPTGYMVQSLPALKGKQEAAELANSYPVFLKQLHELAQKDEFNFSIRGSRDKLNFFTYLLADAANPKIYADIANPHEVTLDELLKVKVSQLSIRPNLHQVPEIITMAEQKIFETAKLLSSEFLVKLMELVTSSNFETYAQESFDRIKLPEKLTSAQR